MAPDLVIVGSMAFDSIKTPFGKVEKTLGGAATYASIAASLFAKPGVVSVVGKDFPEEHLEFMRNRGILTDGIEIADGKTFHWAGAYEYDMNEAHTLKTDLNVLENFSPNVPESFRDAKFVFLGNTDPRVQLSVIEQMDIENCFAALDTMNLWIRISKDTLTAAIKKVNAVFMNDAEIRMYTGTPNIVKAAKEVLKLGPEFVIVKKGEHGSLLFSEDDVFATPAYPLENVVDPTGAGDSFEGSTMGWIAKTNDTRESNLRKAMIFGTAVASFNAEQLGMSKLIEITREDVDERVELMRRITRFD